MSCKPITAAAAAHLDAMIARAERRRQTLENIAGGGEALAREIAVRMIDGPYHPEPRHEPGRAFAVVARAVRFTLVLEAKMDEYLFHLHNGEIPRVAPRPLRATPMVPETVSGGQRLAGLETNDDIESRGPDRECLSERERLDEAGFDAVVGHLCADFAPHDGPREIVGGIQPDNAVPSSCGAPSCVPTEREATRATAPPQTTPLPPKKAVWGTGP